MILAARWSALLAILNMAASVAVAHADTAKAAPPTIHQLSASVRVMVLVWFEAI